MRVIVTLAIEIEDPEEWTLAFGVEGAAMVRDDVKEYVYNVVQQSAAWEEVTATVKLR